MSGLAVQRLKQRRAAIEKAREWGRLIGAGELRVDIEATVDDCALGTVKGCHACPAMLETTLANIIKAQFSSLLESAIKDMERQALEIADEAVEEYRALLIEAGEDPNQAGAMP